MAIRYGGGKGRAASRQAVKNYRRLRRHGKLRPWQRRRPMLRQGPGGTDKGGKNAGRAPTYSDRPASR